MWFYVGCQNFIGKITQKDDSLEIFVSDFMRIWHKSLSDYELVSISQKLNPLFEAPIQKLRGIILNFMRDIKVKKNIKEENDTILLQLESSIMNIKFQFHVLLHQGDKEMFYKECTIPLLLMLIKIQTREKKLIEIIKNKDYEIKDYKQRCGISSNYLTTKPFSEKDFFAQELTADIPWDNSVLECISSEVLTNKVIETGCQIKSEDLPLKKESENMHSADKCEKMSSIFNDKNLQQNSGSKSNILLDNKIIKKRKHKNDGLKIKF